MSLIHFLPQVKGHNGISSLHSVLLNGEITESKKKQSQLSNHALSHCKILSLGYNNCDNALTSRSTPFPIVHPVPSARRARLLYVTERGANRRRLNLE